MKIQNVLVIGAGTMGAGIAQVCLQAGKRVHLFDLDETRIGNANQQIKASLEKLKNSGKWGQEVQIDHLLENRFSFSSKNYGEENQLVIEAILEVESAKKDLYQNLMPSLAKDGIIASNTSSLSISKLAEDLPSKDKFAGLHFFNPATHMPLVEVIAGAETSKETVNALQSFVKELGKTPVIASDSPGFIVNRVARPYYAEGLHLHDKYQAELEDVDGALEAQGFRLGPFKLMDLIGHDVNFSVTSLVYEGLGQPERFTPSNTQKNLVINGLLGKKAGKGFYSY